MNFNEYIEILGKCFKLTKVDDSTYILHKDRKTLEITPDTMYSKDEIIQRINEMYPDVEFTDFKETRSSSENKKKFGNVGEDDLHPAIGRKRRSRPHGSIFDPKDLLDQDETEEGIDETEEGIDKTDISPLKNKRDPDSDHLKKGGNDDNPFLY